VPVLNDPRGPAGDLAGKFGLVPVPGGAGILGVWYWAIPAAAAGVDEAWTFIRWIASKAANAERVGRGGSPVRTSTMADPRVWGRGYGRDYYEAVSAIHQRARPLLSGPNAEEAIRRIGQAVHATVTGQAGVSDAVSGAAADVAELLAG
jgi:multiple sugar transport system substrate-binding protein